MMNTPDHEKAPEHAVPVDVEMTHEDPAVSENLADTGEAIHQLTSEQTGQKPQGKFIGNLRNRLRKNRDERGLPNGSTKGELARKNNYWRKQNDGE